jgi:hypothetical protein
LEELSKIRFRYGCCNEQAYWAKEKSGHAMYVAKSFGAEINLVELVTLFPCGPNNEKSLVALTTLVSSKKLTSSQAIQVMVNRSDILAALKDSMTERSTKKAKPF